MNQQFPVVELMPILGICGCPVIVYLAIQLVTAIILTRALSVLPVQDQKIEPGLVWLLLIPCFNLVWNFIVWLRLADSFQSYFQRMGRTDLGDYGRGVYLAHCILAIVSITPYAGCIAIVADLVLWIIALARVNELREQIVSTDIPV